MEDEILKTMNYYDGIALGYCRLYHEEQERKIGLCADFLPKNGLVLDLGCGDGVLNRFISEKARLVSFDLSFEMLKLNSNSLKVQGSILSLPFLNDSFDCVVSLTVFQDLDNARKAIDEAYRVLKVGGRFILSFLKISKKRGEIKERIKKLFEIERTIEEDKDLIFVLKK